MRPLNQAVQGGTPGGHRQVQGAQQQGPLANLGLHMAPDANPGQGLNLGHAPPVGLQGAPMHNPLHGLQPANIPHLPTPPPPPLPPGGLPPLDVQGGNVQHGGGIGPHPGLPPVPANLPQLPAPPRPRDVLPPLHAQEGNVQQGGDIGPQPDPSLAQRDNEAQFVSKGTFGHGIAAFFRNIGEALTQRTDPSRAERQQLAPDPTPHEMLIGGIARKIGEGKFDARGLTDLVEEHVVHMARTEGMERDKALRELAQALDASTRIGEPERGRIGEAIQAAREREVLKGGRIVEDCLVKSRGGEVDYRGVVQEHVAQLRQGQDPFEALDVLYSQITSGARPREQSNDAYIAVRGKLQAAILEARREILLDRTLGVVTGGLGHEGFSLADRAAGLVQSFLRYARPVYASPGAALEALAGKLNGKVADPALRDALGEAIATAGATGGWPLPPLQERRSHSVHNFAQALLGGSGEVASIDAGPEAGIEQFLKMARSIFDTPREALGALRQDLAYLGQRQPAQERLPDVLKALETAHERDAWPS